MSNLLCHENIQREAAKINCKGEIFRATEIVEEGKGKRKQNKK
jgi:hypothetical protein